MRDSVVFYRSFYEAIENLSPDDFKKSVKAIMEYGLNGIEPKTDGIEKTIFLLTKPQIDANNRRYKNGTKGGRPVTDKKPKNNQSITKREPKEKEKDKENVKDKDIYNVSLPTSGDRPAYPYEDIVAYLNLKAGTHYRYTSEDTKKHIRARINDGYTVDDFKTVINKKVAEWKDRDDMKAYLRPSTLFGTKFETYLNQLQGIGRNGKQTGFSNFEQRDYDFEELEKQLLNVQRNKSDCTTEI